MAFKALRSRGGAHFKWESSECKPFKVLTKEYLLYAYVYSVSRCILYNGNRISQLKLLGMQHNMLLLPSFVFEGKMLDDYNSLFQALIAIKCPVEVALLKGIFD